MKLVELVVASGKGGVGKSTISGSLAALLARKGFKLVAADSDAEEPNLHIVLGIDRWDRIEEYYEGRIAYILQDKCTKCNICAEVCPFGAVEVTDGNYRINEYVCEGCVTCSLACPAKAIRYRFGIVAGHIMFAERTKYGFPLVSGESVPGRPNSGKLVTEVKNRAKAILGSEGVLLLDAAAGIGCQVISSLTGAQFALLVIEPTKASLSDLKRIHKLTKHFMMAPMLVINKYDINPEMIDKIEEYAKEENIPIVGKIPFDESVPNSINMGKLVVEAFPDSPASRELKRIADFIAEEVLSNWRAWYSKYRPKKHEPYIPVIIRPQRG